MKFRARRNPQLLGYRILATLVAFGCSALVLALTHFGTVITAALP